ncbi:ribonuclease III [Erythrobacteraceae bacterium CFH 75059]|uniref:ribonuclease III n=1 Tax=Qipengyuania thermophila TaxID=2509361 RepID=UPI0010227ADA|nr:ribonuclease III [Qipengyuania thermophila]TCD02218.1 ribonuclease III [Erythrobacteraceae bacterium CFH 75059]
MSALGQATLDWLRESGFAVRDEALWRRALTHGSTGERDTYERLEFLGDRVLGLATAAWLYAHDGAAEGRLSQRQNALVSRETCAAVARRIGVPAHLRLGTQARDDGGRDSDNILGDVMEALLGAQFVEEGFEGSAALVHRLWGELLAGAAGQGKHPKSALQEWAAAARRRPPEYSVIGREGPDHAARFTVRVAVHNVGEAQATAPSKQEAEKEAARLFMEKYG